MLNRVPFDEALLSTVGTPRQAELLDSSPRSRVWRVRLADRRLVIVKQITDGGDAGADADTRFSREVAGLRLAGRASGPAVAPAVLATDLPSRVMVLEHLDDLGEIDDWMPGYAESLARLHALTGPADAGALPAWSGPTATDAESFLALAGRSTCPCRPRSPMNSRASYSGWTPPRTMRCCMATPAPAMICARPTASASSTSSVPRSATA